jgi:hypothetical protein
VCVCVCIVHLQVILAKVVWKRSNTFISGPFLSVCKMSIASSIVLYVCCVFNMCCAYLELALFERIAHKVKKQKKKHVEHCYRDN